MTQYHPIPHEPDFDCSLAGLARLEWIHWAVRADFYMPDSLDFFRVRFDRAEVIRVLDEMPLSTDGDKTTGLVPRHFAYHVEGGLFWESQANVLQLIHPKLRHYRFITGWACLDVLSTEPPIFEIVPDSATWQSVQQQSGHPV